MRFLHRPCNQYVICHHSLPLEQTRPICIFVFREKQAQGYLSIFHMQENEKSKALGTN